MKITNIQRFSLHDGPGIRTTVFLKGCNLRCPWCANPENLIYDNQSYIDSGGNQKVVGKEIELDEIKQKILLDKRYYDLNGGVTFSGGEALLQIDKYQELLKELKKENINLAVETALQVNSEFVETAQKYFDLFIVDIKILDNGEIYKINGNINKFLKNIEILFKNNKNVIFRIPLVQNYTYTKKNIDLILDFLKQYKPQKVELFKIHNLAKNKYKLLKMDNFVEKQKITDKQINEIQKEISKLNIKTEVISI